MKKILSLILISMLFVSCLSVTSDGFVQDKTIVGEGVAEITVVPQGGTNETSAYVIYVKNLTDSTIYIDWNESTISYLGQTYLMIIQGDKDHPNGYSISTPIEPGVLDSFTVYSYGQLRIGPSMYELAKIPTSESQVSIAIEKDGMISNYNFDITRKAFEQTLVQKGIYYY